MFRFQIKKRHQFLYQCYNIHPWKSQFFTHSILEEDEDEAMFFLVFKIPLLLPQY
ncbi:MAG: hypothetical protein ACFFAN_08775 [Promethearchaeota archaeon]